MRVLVSCRQAQAVFDEVHPRLEAAGAICTLPAVDQHLDETALLEIIAAYDGVIAGDDHFTARVFDQATRLRVVSKWGVGTDSIDKLAAARCGVTVTNTPGMFDEEVADVAVGYLVLLARGLHTIDAGVRRGEWTKVRGRSLRDLTLGIVGLGGIGRALAQRALVMGMTVVASDPAPASHAWAAAHGVKMLAFDDLLPLVDVVSLHCPPEGTGPLLDADAFTRLPRGAWLVNTGRGALVDEDALVAALCSGHLAGAALDVHTTEPLPAGHVLTRLPNVILGSHNASNTYEANLRTTHAAVDNLLRELAS